MYNDVCEADGNGREKLKMASPFSLLPCESWKNLDRKKYKSFRQNEIWTNEVCIVMLCLMPKFFTWRREKQCFIMSVL